MMSKGDGIALAGMTADDVSRAGFRAPVAAASSLAIPTSALPA